MPRFISLGGDCQPAAQINRFVKGNTGHFFDWLGSPIRQVIRLIENDFRGFLDPANLHPFYIGETLHGVVDNLYNIDINHEILIFNQDYITRVHDLYRLRARWFRDLFDPDEDPPYFIRRWTPRDRDENEQDAVALFDLLQSRRRDIRLLYLHNDPDRPERIDGGYRSIFVRQTTPFLWGGDDEAWDYILHDFAVRGAGEHDRTQIYRRLPRFT